MNLYKICYINSGDYINKRINYCVKRLISFIYTTNLRLKNINSIVKTRLYRHKFFIIYLFIIDCNKINYKIIKLSIKIYIHHTLRYNPNDMKCNWKWTKSSPHF